MQQLVLPHDTHVTEPTEVRLTGPNPSGLCMCGCGQQTNPARRDDSRYGVVKGQPQRYVFGHRPGRQGSNHHCWNGGKRTSTCGYALIHVEPGGHPRRSTDGYVREHVLVVERAIGRLLPDGAVVHHVNDDKTDNRPSNLVVLQDNSEHMRMHRRRDILRAGANPWTERICAFCKQIKPISECYVHNGITAGCKPCYRAYQGELRRRKKSPPILPHDTHVVDPRECVRLSAQNQRVLARLQQGPASRVELQWLACNPTARISDLRAAGYSIPPPVEDRTTGVSVYRLEAK